MTPQKKALFLSYFTVVYNVLEGVISLFAGGISGSIALVGFGLDSFVESFSGGVMIWKFRKHGKVSEEEEKQVEQKAQKLVGWSFYLLAAYVFVQAVRKLYVHEIPDPSLIGVIVAILSIIIMPILFVVKYRIGKELHSHSFMADSKQTLICSLMSVALLIGVGLNYFFGFWWADPAAGLVIVYLAAREGREVLKSDRLCCG